MERKEFEKWIKESELKNHGPLRDRIVKEGSKGRNVIDVAVNLVNLEELSPLSVRNAMFAAGRKLGVEREWIEWDLEHRARNGSEAALDMLKAKRIRV